MPPTAPALAPLFTIELDPGPVRDIGPTPAGKRRIVPVVGGRFVGEALRGVVVAGEDWITERNDGSFHLDVRLTLTTDDGQNILMRYQGLRHGPAEVMARLARGEDVAPEQYYFRIAPVFETASEPYAWLNRILAIGSGRRRPQAVIYDIWQVL